MNGPAPARCAVVRTACFSTIGRVSVLLPILLLSACRSPRGEARRAVAAELTSRERDRAKSMRLFEQGMKARRNSEAPAARRHLAAAVNADPDNVYAWMALGAAEFEREGYFEAAQAFHEAARLAPTRFEPRYNLGTVFEAVGRYDDAITEYETALGLEPGQLEVTENLARAYVRAGRNSERAKELVDRALQAEFRPEWRAWLERMSVRLKPPEPTTRAASTTPPPTPMSPTSRPPAE